MSGNEKYARALDRLIDAKDEIARLTAELAKPWLASDEVARLPEAEKTRRRKAAVDAIRDKGCLAKCRAELESAHALLGEWPAVQFLSAAHNDLRTRTRELLGG